MEFNELIETRRSVRKYAPSEITKSPKGPIPPTGNTNTHGKFLPDVRTFLKRWSMENAAAKGEKLKPGEGIKHARVAIDWMRFE